MHLGHHPKADILPGLASIGPVNIERVAIVPIVVQVAMVMVEHMAEMHACLVMEGLMEVWVTVREHVAAMARELQHKEYLSLHVCTCTH